MSRKLKTALVGAASAGLLGAAATASAAQYANVVSATPVAESVAVPRQDCVQSERLVQAPPSGAGALIGAIAGGVIGNQFGHGFGRAAATGVGAVAGSAIGNNVEANANPPQSVPVRQCRTINAYESRVVGYDVVYEYNGQRYTTRLPNDPGPRLAIDVRPTASAPLDRVGPPASYGAVPPVTQAQAAPSYNSAPPTYYDAPPAYDAPPVYYGAAPAYYSAPYSPVPYYVAPAAIGLGIGYWIGNTWHRGYRYGWHGHRGWH